MLLIWQNPFSEEHSENNSQFHMMCLPHLAVSIGFTSPPWHVNFCQRETCIAFLLHGDIKLVSLFRYHHPLYYKLVDACFFSYLCLVTVPFAASCTNESWLSCCYCHVTVLACHFVLTWLVVWPLLPSNGRFCWDWLYIPGLLQAEWWEEMISIVNNCFVICDCKCEVSEC